MLSPRTNEKVYFSFAFSCWIHQKRNGKLLHLQWHCCVQSSCMITNRNTSILNTIAMYFFLTLQWISKCEFPWHLKEYQKIIFIYFLLQKNRKKKLKFYKLVGKFDFSPNAHTSQDFEEWNFLFSQKTFPLKYLLLCLCFPLLPKTQSI